MKGPVKNFTDALDGKKIRYVILETRRKKDVQEAYYAQGRDSRERINALRVLAGLPEIGVLEAQKIITWTKVSKHIDGLAIDIAPVVSGKIPWIVSDRDTAAKWLEIAEVGESCGLTWGGRWNPVDKYGLGRDCPHYELTV